MHGIPFSIKDNLATRGIRTTAGGKILADWVPDFDATAPAAEAPLDPSATIDECQKGYVQFDGRKLPRQDGCGGLESLCCIPFNVTGLPSISVCCGFSQTGMPVGLQIAAGSFQERLLFQAAHAYG